MHISKNRLKEIIAEELTNFNRETGAPQTEEGRLECMQRPVCAEKHLDAEGNIIHPGEGAQELMARMKSIYGSWANIPSSFKKTIKAMNEEISPIYADNSSASPNADVPAINDQSRAQDLLNGFKNLLKPEEQQVAGSCGTFLRQLAAMSDQLEKAAQQHAPAPPQGKENI